MMLTLNASIDKGHIFNKCFGKVLSVGNNNNHMQRLIKDFLKKAVLSKTSKKVSIILKTFF